MANPWKLKQEMCEIGRRMYERGLVSAFEGNLSARIAPDRLLCTPSRMCKGYLKPDDLCVVDMTGKQWGGERKRSSEIFLHLGIYRERFDVDAVVHTHSPHATAFAITHTAVPNCITGEVEMFLGEVPLAPYATPGSPAMGEAVAPFIHQSNVVLLANHGVVSCGKSLEEALHRTEMVETYCRTLILARQLGAVQRLSDQSMHDLLTVKRQLGIPDHRTSFLDCDLSGNGVFGRGFCESEKSANVRTAWATPARPASTDVARAGAAPLPAQTQSVPHPVTSTTEVDAIVREIVEQVIAAVNGQGAA